MSFSTLAWRLSPLFLVLASVIWLKFYPVTFFELNVIRVLPYLLSIVLFLYAGMFNRSRFLAPILITVITYIFIREKLQSSLEQDHIMAMFTGVNVLFCAQLIFAAIYPDKGMFNRIGGIFIFILFAGGIAVWFLGMSIQWIQWLETVELHKESLFQHHYWITNALLFLHVSTLLVLSLIWLWRRSVADYALIITWFAGALVFFNFSVPEVSSYCFTTLLVALFLVFQQSNYQVTFMDALTGIPARRALEDYLTTLGRHYSVAMLDVDHFKKFNDTYGHDVGDQVLKMVAAKISQVQGGGRAFRYGGEEFTIVFNRKSADDAFVFLEAVRESVQNYSMTLRSDDREDDIKEGKKQRGKQSNKAKTVSVTISIGLANSASGLTPMDVIKLADDKLYKAKESGRNCTVKPVTENNT